MSALPQGEVALWERDPSHPDGEAWVDGYVESYLVGETDAVHERISRGVLVVVPEPKSVAESVAAPAKEAKRK